MVMDTTGEHTTELIYVAGEEQVNMSPDASM